MSLRYSRNGITPNADGNGGLIATIGECTGAYIVIPGRQGATIGTDMGYTTPTTVIHHIIRHIIRTEFITHTAMARMGGSAGSTIRPEAERRLQRWE